MTGLLASEFRPFSVQHAVCVGVCAALIGCAVSLRRRWRDDGRGRRLDAALCWAGLVVWCVVQGWYVWPGHFAWGESLPLHVCDLAALLGPIVLVRPRRSMRVLVQFWGMGLCTQGFLTPVLTEGMEHPRFWMFWANHTVAVGCAVYDAAARGFRPRWGDVWRAVGMTSVYAAAMVALDAATGWNYGYFGPSTPGNPTVLDALGVWPWRLGPMFVIGVAAFVMVWAGHRVVRGKALE